MKTSIYVEQRGDAPAKVQSGTMAVIYRINCDPAIMRLRPIVERAKRAGDLNFALHIRPTIEQSISFRGQLQVIITRVLTTFSKPFHYLAEHPQLQHKARRPLPLKKMEQFPLRVSTINEATVVGTIQVLSDVYETQLQMTPEMLDDIAVPSINDQLTNARGRGAKILRSKDVSSFTRAENMQLGYGVFHKIMNFVWGLRKTHQGAIDQIGSLKFFFALLEKTRLGNEKPDYHTLVAALMQILHGLLLNAWRTECGFPTLAAFAGSKPTAKHLLKIAAQILDQYATPMEECGKSKESPDKIHDDTGNSSESDESERESTPELSNSTSAQSCHDPQADHAHQNIRLLTRDLLYVAELLRAVSDGDYGRIEDILGNMAMMFRGAGSNNYCTELLHFIFNLKLVWGDKFAYVQSHIHALSFTNTVFSGIL